MSPLISIIIPIYNGEKFIHNLIDSMLNQTLNFENLEIILINNKSTDNSEEILMELSQKYSNIKTITLERHYPTPGKSRNVGIKESSANYIMFCDQDDSYLNDFCEKMYNKISSVGVDLVTSRYTVNIPGKENYLNNSFLKSYSSEIKLNFINEFPEVIQTQANLTIWNKIYKKQFILENNINFVEEHWAEDFLFSLEVYLKANGILLLNDYSGYLYTVDDNSQSHIQPPKKDFYNNGIVTLYEARNLLLKNNLEVMPFVSEFLVTWVRLFLNSNLDNNDLYDIYGEFKPWLDKYSFNTKLVNLSISLNVFINVSIKLFSLSKYIMIFSNNFLKLINFIVS